MHSKREILSKENQCYWLEVTVKTKEKAALKFDSTEESLNTGYLIGYSRHLDFFCLWSGLFCKWGGLLGREVLFVCFVVLVLLLLTGWLPFFSEAHWKQNYLILHQSTPYADQHYFPVVFPWKFWWMKTFRPCFSSSKMEVRGIHSPHNQVHADDHSAWYQGSGL